MGGARGGHHREALADGPALQRLVGRPDARAGVIRGQRTTTLESARPARSPPVTTVLGPAATFPILSAHFRGTSALSAPSGSTARFFAVQARRENFGQRHKAVRSVDVAEPVK